MKNIQIIDGADNCVYDIYAATDGEFRQIFEGDTDIEFVEDFFGRLGENKAAAVMNNIWKRPINKKHAMGIHGTLFYQLTHKKRYYPTKREDEAVALGDDEET